MLVPSRLACVPLLARSLLRIRYGFPQRPLCDLISASLGLDPENPSDIVTLVLLEFLGSSATFTQWL
jgi:hypothetical protein